MTQPSPESLPTPADPPVPCASCAGWLAAGSSSSLTCLAGMM
jgi:hypothetical protein